MNIPKWRMHASFNQCVTQCKVNHRPDTGCFAADLPETCSESRGGMVPECEPLQYTSTRCTVLSSVLEYQKVLNSKCLSCSFCTQVPSESPE